MSKLKDNQLRNHFQTPKITKLIKNSTLNSKCTGCNKSVNNKLKSLPCSVCKSLIHKKCSYVTNTTILDIDRSWICPYCFNSAMPFSNEPNEVLDDIFHQKKANEQNKKTSLTENITKSFKMLEIPELSNTNCDYFDDTTFKAIKDEIKPEFTILHTNINSISAHNDDLSILINETKCHFDIICLSETHHSKKNNHLFNPSNVHGYQKYYGSTRKSGSGFFISDKINYVPRNDLNKHFYNDKEKFEACWIKNN